MPAQVLSVQSVNAIGHHRNGRADVHDKGRHLHEEARSTQVFVQGLASQAANAEGTHDGSTLRMPRSRKGAISDDNNASSPGSAGPNKRNDKAEGVNP